MHEGHHAATTTHATPTSMRTRRQREVDANRTPSQTRRHRKTNAIAKRHNCKADAVNERSHSPHLTHLLTNTSHNNYATISRHSTTETEHRDNTTVTNADASSSPETTIASIVDAKYIKSIICAFEYEGPAVWRRFDSRGVRAKYDGTPPPRRCSTGFQTTTQKIHPHLLVVTQLSTQVNLSYFVHRAQPQRLSVPELLIVPYRRIVSFIQQPCIR